ncbi:MAG: FAD-dependent oxidoreductase [Candidatus Hydrogenedentes bacterium]|nr:FAD-dependent oxidoreductase [Candidatus Hydrogenedentota bacterium]
MVLVGAGHAHLYVARHAAEFRKRGVELLLIDPGMFWYSGMATGMLGGMYSPGADQVDPGRLITACGGRFIQQRVVGLDRERQRLLLEDGGVVGFDLVSFNVGSGVPLEDIEGAADHAASVKPIANLAQLRQQLEEAFLAQVATPHVVILGGGPTGCEVGANLCALAHRNRRSLRLTLVTRSDRLLPQAPRGSSRAILRALKRHGIRIMLRQEIARIAPGKVITGTETLLCDQIIGAVGLKASPLAEALGLPCDEAGLRTDDCLRSVNDHRVFGAGDCISFCGRDLPKLGVFGVRQAPVLLQNLLAALDGAAPRAYRPPKRYLTILNLGENDGLAMRGRLWWRGRSALWLKHAIDSRFVKGYRALYQ